MSDLKQQLFNYYAMMQNGYFIQSHNRPNGFENFVPSYAIGSNVPQGIMADRHWKLMIEVEARWRSELGPEYGSSKVDKLLASGKIKPMVFTDVDFALIDRDAQGHIDQYVVDRATLEALGFIAQYYEELRDPEKRLVEIKGSASTDRCFEIGQDLFHATIVKLIEDLNAMIPASYAIALVALAQKKPQELTDEDYKTELATVEDSFYELIVNPLRDHFEKQPQSKLKDVQGGKDRMKLIYTTIAAFSHSQIEDSEEMLRHRSFADFKADEHLYPGVREFMQAASGSGLEVVAITRGNQFPFMKASGSGIDDLFDRVHSTLIASKRRKKTETLYILIKRLDPILWI